MDKKKNEINIINRKARFEYHILESFNAGMVLQGTEIKSIREGNINMTEAYCLIDENGIVLKNMHISEFKNGGHYNHAPLRDRRLLLKKREINKIKEALKERGVTLIPLRLFSGERGYAKLEIAIAKGKKNFDKREDIKQKDIEREMKRFV